MLMAWKSKSDFNICSADFHTFHLFFFRSTKIMHIGSNFFPTKIVKLQFASSKPSVSLRFSWKFCPWKISGRSSDDIWILNDALFRKKHHHFLRQLKDSFFSYQNSITVNALRSMPSTHQFLAFNVKKVQLVFVITWHHFEKKGLGS